VAKRRKGTYPSFPAPRMLSPGTIDIKGARCAPVAAAMTLRACAAPNSCTAAELVLGIDGLAVR
jgi:hypothetical protein